jgi:hypothetical protein
MDSNDKILIKLIFFELNITIFIFNLKKYISFEIIKEKKL